MNVTQIIEPFFECDSNNWTFWNVTPRIEPFFERDSKSWTFFWTWLQELNFFFFWKTWHSKTWTFSNLTQGLKIFLKWLKNWTFFFTWLNKWNLCLVWLRELNPLFLNMFQWIEPSFSLTQRIELFFMSRNTIQTIDFFHDSKNWTILSTNDSKNWNIFESKNWIFSKKKNRLKELNLFSTWLKEFNMTQRIEPFFCFSLTERFFIFLNMSQRIEPF